MFSTRPLLPVAELLLPLPEARALWLERSATGWMKLHLSLSFFAQKRPVSLVDWLREPTSLTPLPDLYDEEYCQIAQAYAACSLVCDFRQATSIFTTENLGFTEISAYSSQSWAHRLQEMMSILSLSQCRSNDHVSTVASLVRETAGLHSCSHLDQIELLVGREGREEAHRAYCALQKWARSRSARSAVWHAGQVVRYFRNLPFSYITEFHAVACYHAGLCLWAYCALLRCGVLPHDQTNNEADELVLIDAEETLSSERWILLGRGRPVISMGCTGHEILLRSTHRLMTIFTELLQDKFANSSSLPPLIVEKICELMRLVGQRRLDWATHDTSSKT